MTPLAYLRHPRSQLCAAATVIAASVLLSGCPAQQHRPVVPPAAERPPTPTMKPRPTPTPRVPLEESAIGETAAFTPPPGATPAETPSPTASVMPEAAATSADPESLLTHIKPGTPPNVAAALRLIEDGRQEMAHGAYDAALDRLERAVAIDPTSAYGYYFLAKVHLLKKDYDQAIAFASRAASLSARGDPISLGRIHSLQGAAFEEVGRYPDARKAYQEAIEADPNNLAARVGAARVSGGQ